MGTFGFLFPKPFCLLGYSCTVVRSLALFGELVGSDGRVARLALSAALLITSSTIFVAVYSLLFSDLLCGATPGRRLALLASGRSNDAEPAQRFRYNTRAQTVCKPSSAYGFPDPQ